MLTMYVDGAKLRRTREARGLTCVALAEVVGCSRWNIYGIEKGRHQPSAPTFLRLCKALDVEPGELASEVPADTSGDAA